MNPPSENGQANDKAEESNDKISPATTELQMPPAVGNSNKPNGQEKHWLDYAKFGLEVLGFLVLCAYAYFTIRIYCANQKAADAATIAAKAAQDGVLESQKNRAASEIQSGAALDALINNFRQEQRPYVCLVGIKNPITLTLREKVRWDVSYLNFGRSPALGVVIYGKLWVGTDEAAGDIDQYFKDLPTRKASAENVLLPVLGEGREDSPTFKYSTIMSDWLLTPDVFDFIKKTNNGLVLTTRIWYSDWSGATYYTDNCRTTLTSGVVAECAKYNRFYEAPSKKDSSKR